MKTTLKNIDHGTTKRKNGEPQRQAEGQPKQDYKRVKNMGKDVDR
jgi:hypothetical protein